MGEEPNDNQPWSNLSTITTVENGNESWPTKRANDSQDAASGRQLVERVVPSPSLLTETVIQQLCTMIEPDPVKRNKLYFILCDKLHDMKLLDSSYNMDEFESIRGQYQMALYQLVTFARAAVGCNTIIQNPNVLTDFPRYQLEFEELSFIGSGGFGQVYKARHRLDGNEYAVKKICVRPNRIEKIRQHLEEVKTLAKFDHTNIVTYKGAWIEKTVPAALPCLRETQRESRSLRLSESTRITSSRRSQSCRQSSTTSIVSQHSESGAKESDRSSNCKSESLFNQFQSNHKTSTYVTSAYEQRETFEQRENASGISYSNDIITERLQQLNSTTNIIGRRIEERSSSRVVEEGDSDVVSFRYDEEDCNNGSRKKSYSASDGQDVNSSEETEESDVEGAVADRRVCQYTSSVRQEFATLYIQMALCEQTLRQWLDERQEITAHSIVIQILSQVLAGLQYMHSRRTVHHDIKPRNIFITRAGQLHVQLGDFGLACPLQQESHRPDQGTQLYAAPEQLKGQCDPKSDIYSLGVVLFEILIPMKTSMEVCDKMGQFKDGHIPEILVDSPKWVEMLRKLLNVDPTKRPTATELLQDLTEDKDVMIATKDGIIRELKQENEKLRDELVKLQTKMSKLEMQDQA